MRLLARPRTLRERVPAAIVAAAGKLPLKWVIFARQEGLHGAVDVTLEAAIRRRNATV
jgi:hypothetical protein